MDRKLVQLAAVVGSKLRVAQLLLTSAESCTGGLLSAALTETAGASLYFERGFVTYSDRAKQDMLGVPEALLQSHGAVSEAVARAMAQGALVNSRAQVSVAITGVAGPGGGSADKPVGTICFAWALSHVVVAETRWFAGGRELVRAAAVEHALRGVVTLLAQDQ